MAGYSGTPLVRKLGIKAQHRVGLVQAPDGFADTLHDLPPNVTLQSNLRGPAPFDVLLFFTRDRADLEGRFADLARRLTVAGALWVAWPKKASGVATDLTENVVREVGLEGGLVDVKVCAIDDIWSGLRFVRRLADRPKSAGQK
jgi:hypothetical protein